jgi:hypothetical protein
VQATAMVRVLRRRTRTVTGLASARSPSLFRCRLPPPLRAAAPTPVPCADAAALLSPCLRSRAARRCARSSTRSARASPLC